MAERAPDERKVVRSWTATYPDPLQVRAGESLIVEDRESEWPGWVWCENPSGTGGWVPAGWVRRSGAEGVALRDYSAAELSVTAGDVVRVGETESGWVWCVNSEGTAGWVPLKNLASAS